MSLIKKSCCCATQPTKLFIKSMILPYILAKNVGKIFNTANRIIRIPNPKMSPKKGIIIKLERKNNAGNWWK